MLTPEQQTWAHRFACQLLVSRTPWMPSCADHPDRVARQTRQLRDSVEYYGRLAAESWNKKHPTEPAEQLPFSHHIALLVVEATETAIAADNQIALELSNALP